MVDNKCNLAMLSTQRRTYFFARGKKEFRNVLYSSRVYRRASLPTRATFAWFALACRVINWDILQLPRPRTEHWQGIKWDQITASGIVVPSVVHMVCETDAMTDRFHSTLAGIHGPQRMHRFNTRLAASRAASKRSSSLSSQGSDGKSLGWASESEEQEMTTSGSP